MSLPNIVMAVDKELKDLTNAWYFFFNSIVILCGETRQTISSLQKY